MSMGVTTTTNDITGAYVVRGEDAPGHGQVRAMFYGAWHEILYGPDIDGAYILRSCNGRTVRVRYHV